MLLDVPECFLHFFDGGILVCDAEDCLRYQTTCEKCGRNAPKSHEGSLDSLSIYEILIFVVWNTRVVAVGSSLGYEDKKKSRELTSFAFLL